MSNIDFKWDDSLVKEFCARILLGNDKTTDEALIKFKESKQHKPEWEVIEYKGKSTGKIYQKIPSGSWCSTDGTSSFNDNAIIRGDSGCEIYSVKRLSDEVVFTIGDRVKYYGASNYGWFIINNFFIRKDGHMIVSGADYKSEFISDITLAMPILKTMDGVNIYKGDDYYFIDSDWDVKYCKDHLFVCDNIKAFSSKERASEYVINNKPLFSVENISDILKGTFYLPIFIEKAKEILESTRSNK